MITFKSFSIKVEILEEKSSYIGLFKMECWKEKKADEIDFLHE